MNTITHIRERAKRLGKRIVLPEGADVRIIKAAAHLDRNQICTVFLLGHKEDILDTAAKENITLSEDVLIIDPTSDDRLKKYEELVFINMKKKGVSKGVAKKLAQNSVYFGACLLASGEVDACIAGAVFTTGDVIRAAIEIVGLNSESNVVSSTFLMSFKDETIYTYADCAVVPTPNAQQLASIALDSAKTHKTLTGQDPRVAMLSFSTHGSASHKAVDKVVQATKLASHAKPDLLIDGDLQFDAAVIESIAEQKAPNSPLKGDSNVFIFPNLDAANIAYKITERLAGATATGPILQGLDKPMMDLSRGCNWVDVVNTACVAILLSEPRS